MMVFIIQDKVDKLNFQLKRSNIQYKNKKMAMCVDFPFSVT